MNPPRVAVIGAGSSGIAATKALADRSISVVCFEKSDRVGGNWVFGNINGMSAAYRGLYINTSRERMQFAEFAMPKDYPDFPHHTQIARYFEDYVDHFGIRSKIRFQTGVAHVTRSTPGTGDVGWDVICEKGETSRFDAIVVANGHHWDPRWPEPAFPGDFAGLIMHSHAYIDAKPFEDRNVLVVGMGNSAMDIAVEASEGARRTFLSARRGVHIIPKYLFGRPVDQVATSHRIPWFVKQKLLEGALRLAVGKMESYGLPKPDHRVGEAHPTISGRILDRLVHGAVTPKPNVRALEGRRVRFTDGSVEDVDIIVYCTGYKVTFPFFDEALVSAKDNDLPLFRRVFKPDLPGLMFAGLLQPLGAVMPLVEAQGQWIAKYFVGDYVLPPRAEMEADIARERSGMFKRYVASKRHTMQVDFDDYLHSLALEVERGRARARARASKST
jgi:dimethylaniline monooxygenase (N-oxide forming)